MHAVCCSVVAPRACTSSAFPCPRTVPVLRCRPQFGLVTRALVAYDDVTGGEPELAAEDAGGESAAAIVDPLALHFPPLVPDEDELQAGQTEPLAAAMPSVSGTVQLTFPADVVRNLPQNVVLSHAAICAAYETVSIVGTTTTAMTSTYRQGGSPLLYDMRAATPASRRAVSYAFTARFGEEVLSSVAVSEGHGGREA